MKQIPNIKYRRDLFRLFDKPGMVAEIGVAEGNFSEDILKWRQFFEDEDGTFEGATASRLYLVDRWKQVSSQKGDASMSEQWHSSNFKQVRERIRRYGKRAVILRGDSVAMSRAVRDKSLWLVYVDGDHSYEGVFADIRAWAPKVKPGGFMAFHDYENPNYGVKEAVKTFCGKDLEIHLIEEDKLEDAGAFFQIPF